jgi:hypothetical protein
MSEVVEHFALFYVHVPVVACVGGIELPMAHWPYGVERIRPLGSYRHCLIGVQWFIKPETVHCQRTYDMCERVQLK